MAIKKVVLSANKQLIILLIIALGLNINTLFNEYAVDDGIVMTQNSIIKKGIKGIPELLSTDLMKGINKTGNLSQPRYRPFSLIVSALEYQFFGAKPMISHLINILLFGLLIGLLFNLLQNFVFREQHRNLAFITCLLFAIHPIHTEVIANVKSRDELLTFLLLVVSLITFFKYLEQKKKWLLFSGLLCFFLALLTRESAVTFVALVPLIFYFFANHTLKKAIQFSIPLIFVFAGYMLLRFLIVGFGHVTIIGIENDPFLFATVSQAFATKVFILTKYLKLLFMPYPLSWEYGYNQIPYVNLLSFQFIFSFLLITSLIVYAILTFRQKSIFSFCVFYFFLTLSLVANFLVDVGTPFSERFLFQPSLAFCIVIATLFLQLNKNRKLPVNLIFIFILLLFSLKTIFRNAEWKNNETLYLTDVKSSPNSIRANSAAANILLFKGYYETNVEIKKMFLKKSIYYAEKALKIDHNNQRVYRYWQSSFYGLFDSYKSADLFFQDNDFNFSDPKVKIALDNLSTDNYKKGNGFLELNVDNAIECYLKSVALNKYNIEAWYNLGGGYFIKNDTTNAIKAWDKVKALDPNHSFNKAEFLVY